MKRLVLSLCVLSVMGLVAMCADKDSKLFVEIPDANFKAYLLENFDANKDGKISLKEAKAIKVIDCSNRNIEALDGIEKFSNLTSLNCSNNLLDELELNENKKLNKLVCTNNINPLTIYLSMSSPLRNKKFVAPKKNATPDASQLVIPIDVNKVVFDNGKTNFNISFGN